jgi:hypothetical protein
MRSTLERLERDIAFHLERAVNLERYANHWWRFSKYAWLHAATIHRNAARELQAVGDDIADARTAEL